MGFSISWAAFNGIDKQAVLSLTGFRELEVETEIGEGDHSIAELPGGWTLIFSNDFNRFTTELVKSTDRLKSLSSQCRILTCSVEEHVMYSSAANYENGEETWRVVHDFNSGKKMDLTISGSPPPVLEEIKQ